MKKYAAVTDDQKTISPHFGRATKYVVVSVEDGQIIDRGVRDKLGHRDFQREGSHEHHHQDQHDHGHGFGKHSADKHRRMFESILDCDVVLARGMGQGAYQGLQQSGIRPVLTIIADIDTAIQAVIDGDIVDHTERLH